MDLGTVKSRLENKYYWSARECMRDLNSMFTNCYVYYPSTHEIIGETLALESFYLSEVGCCFIVTVIKKITVTVFNY